MKHTPTVLMWAELIFVATVLTQGMRSAEAANAEQQPSTVRVVDLKAPDGTLLKATYFAAAKPGPGVLLFHQSNRTRKSWEDVATRLAEVGITTLTVDARGFGETGTPYDKMTDKEKDHVWKSGPGDIEAAWQYLISQPGVQRDVIGLGGAGALGVGHTVDTARRHQSEVKSLVLLSGETLRSGLLFLRQASQLPGLFVVSDDDEYPPTAEAMEYLYITSSSPEKQFVHYVGKKAPWLWYEPWDIGRVSATGSHGTDLFKRHPELPGIIVDWLVTTLIKTPGHAPPDAVAAASILNQLETPGGVAQVEQLLKVARRRDPKAQLFPEINVDIIATDHLRDGETKPAIEIYKLNLLAYPDSADAHANLAGAYLKDGQKDLARKYAQQAISLLDSHAAPASSWSDTEQRRSEIRRDLERTLKRLDEAQR